MLPVQRHVQRPCRAPVRPASRLQVTRRSAPADAGPSPCPPAAAVDKRMGRRHGMPRQFHVPVAQAPHPAGLQIVLGVEDQAGRPRQAARPDAARRSGAPRRPGWRPRGSAWRPAAGCCSPPAGRAVPVTAASTAPLRSHSAVWSWSSTASSTSTGASAAKAATAGANQVARLSALTAIGSATRVTPFRRQRRQRALQFLLEQPHAVDVLAQAPAGVGGAAGLAAHDQRAAHPLFQRTDALRHRRGRDDAAPAPRARSCLPG